MTRLLESLLQVASIFRAFKPNLTESAGAYKGIKPNQAWGGWSDGGPWGHQPQEKLDRLNRAVDKMSAHTHKDEPNKHPDDKMADHHRMMHDYHDLGHAHWHAAKKAKAEGDDFNHEYHTTEGAKVRAKWQGHKDAAAAARERGDELHAHQGALDRIRDARNSHDKEKEAFHSKNPGGDYQNHIKKTVDAFKRGAVGVRPAPIVKGNETPAPAELGSKSLGSKEAVAKAVKSRQLMKRLAGG